MQGAAQLLKELPPLTQSSWAGKQSTSSSSSPTSLQEGGTSPSPLIVVPALHSRWSPVNSIRRHLQDREAVSLTAFLWPIDSTSSEENDNIQEGTVVYKHRLDIDFWETEMPLEQICL